MPTTSTFTIRLERGADGSAVRAEVRCAFCQRTIFPRAGLYALRLTLSPDGNSVRGAVRTAGGNVWHFSSGDELAALVQRLGHQHDGEDSGD